MATFPLNAHCEIVAEKSRFRAAFKTKRCIVPASGFCEWTGERGHKTHHFFSDPTGNPLLFAGLRDEWHDPEKKKRILSVTIIVGHANDWMARFHDRMPVLIAPKKIDDWFLRERPDDLLRPASLDALQQ